jgi:Domain of unknown function (DUF397)
MKLVSLGRKTVKPRRGDYTVTNWLKSSLSAANGDCVEAANLAGGLIGVRDSKDAAGPVLRFTPREWDAFLGGVRKGEFDALSKQADR